ncbi:hypothetical protein [Actinomadura montaniterrae]|uniref:Uncharacterized protein n=1 Tax=Actinomadura montaniterrae TaxID=1803903 RepID=A0A6L3VX86_9ACTN|nr:hypothetical protein [Actinomadura montaniterrae]KAB2379694.1 hypothetical protein F9B16_19390 [Actinomadura montaniterrae]
MRLYDHRTGQAEEVPPGRVLRVQVLEGAGHRALVVADLLRRVGERAGREVPVACSPDLSVHDRDWTDYNIAPFELLDWDAPPPDADLYIASSTNVDADAPWMLVPHESGDWYSVMANASMDALAARLAMLEVPYRDPLELTASRFMTAAARLEAWRSLVAGWARSPGRPMDRDYARKAEAALGDDLDSPAALAVLDEIAADPDVPPGAKLETFIHLDLTLALGLVAAIGAA